MQGRTGAAVATPKPPRKRVAHKSSSQPTSGAAVATPNPPLSQPPPYRVVRWDMPTRSGFIPVEERVYSPPTTRFTKKA